MQYFTLLNPERDEYFEPSIDTYAGVISGSTRFSDHTVEGQQALAYLETPVNWDAAGFQSLYDNLAEYGRSAEQVDDPQSFAMHRLRDHLNSEFGYAGRWATDRTIVGGDYDTSVDPDLFHDPETIQSIARDYNQPDDLSIRDFAVHEESPYRDVTDQVQQEVQKLQVIFQMDDLSDRRLEDLQDTSVLERMDRAFSTGLPGELERVLDASEVSDWDHDTQFCSESIQPSVQPNP